MKKLLNIFVIVFFLIILQTSSAIAADNIFCDCPASGAPEQPGGNCIGPCQTNAGNKVCQCADLTTKTGTENQTQCDTACGQKPDDAQSVPTDYTICNCKSDIPHTSEQDPCKIPCSKAEFQSTADSFVCVCKDAPLTATKLTDATQPEREDKCKTQCVSAAKPATPTTTTPAGQPAAKVSIEAPNLYFPIPDLQLSNITVSKEGGDKISVPWIAEYIIAIYKYSLGIASILAVIMVMIAGLLYLTSAGNPQRIGQAKNYIIGAISGLVILVSSYMILSLISPNLTKLGPIVIQSVEAESIDESEFGLLETTDVPVAGDVPYFAQTDKRWACFPFTGNECSYQLDVTPKLACGTDGYSASFPDVSSPPERGILGCKHKNIEFKGMNYCEWLESQYQISAMCNNPNMKDSAWCENNPYGKNNFVEYCKKVTIKNKDGKSTNLNVIQSSGCGMTSSAMVLNFYGISVTPPDVALWIQENGIRSPSPGSSEPPTCCGFVPVGMKVLAQHHSLDTKKMSSAKENPEVMSLLQKKLPLIFHVSTRQNHPNCKFTKGGHFIVVKNYAGGVFGINDPSHPGIKTASASDIWDECAVHSVTYFYKPGAYGEFPSLQTADTQGTSQTSIVAGDCKSVPDLSPYDKSTGCYNADLQCTPQDIKNVAEAWGQTNMITAPNSCARTASRILRNAGCQIPGSPWIKSLKTQLKNIGWKALIIHGSASSKYPNQIPIGVLFQCNATGTLQHVFISTGQGNIVESGTDWSSGCTATGCPKQNSKTCGQNNLKDKCAPDDNSIPGMNALTGSPSKNYKDCGEGKNQCVNTKSGAASKASIVFFPLLDSANEGSGCCKSDLIRYSKGISNSKDGIKTSQATCQSLSGSWTAGGSCSEPLNPVQAVSGVLAPKGCGCQGQGWCK